MALRVHVCTPRIDKGPGSRTAELCNDPSTTVEKLRRTVKRLNKEAGADMDEKGSKADLVRQLRNHYDPRHAVKTPGTAEQARMSRLVAAKARAIPLRMPSRP